MNGFPKIHGIMVGALDKVYFLLSLGKPNIQADLSDSRKAAGNLVSKWMSGVYVGTLEKQVGPTPKFGSIIDKWWPHTYMTR